MKKILDVLLSALHVVAGFGILILGQLIGSIVAKPFPSSSAAFVAVSTVVYLITGILMIILYGKFVARLSIKEMALVNIMPEAKWVILGLALPLAVTAFYVFFTGGALERGSADLPMILANGVLSAAVAGIVEEISFRGMMMRAFLKKWNLAAALILPSMVFAVIHVVTMPSVTPAGVLQLTVGGTMVGVMFSLIVLYSGSIWSSAIVHALWNIIIIGGTFVIQAPGCGVTEIYLYKYALTSTNVLLSGGAFGIESALPGILCYTGISIVLFLLLQKRKAK